MKGCCPGSTFGPSDPKADVLATLPSQKDCVYDRARDEEKRVRERDRQIYRRSALLTINMMYFLQDDVNVKFTYTGIREGESSDIDATSTTETAVKIFLQNLVLSFG